MAAAVSYSDGEEVNLGKDEGMLKMWISPATMDSADYVTPPALSGKTVRVLSCFDATTGIQVTATLSAGVVTIDAAGGTTDHVYHLLFVQA